MYTNNNGLEFFGVISNRVVNANGLWMKLKKWCQELNLIEYKCKKDNHHFIDSVDKNVLYNFSDKIMSYKLFIEIILKNYRKR